MIVFVISVADLRQELRDLEQQGEVDRQRFESEMEESEAEVLTLHDEIEAGSMRVDDLLRKISQLEEVGIHDAALLAQAVEDRDNLAVELDRIRAEHHLYVDASKAERESLQRAHDGPWKDQMNMFTLSNLVLLIKKFNHTAFFNIYVLSMYSLSQHMPTSRRRTSCGSSVASCFE